jgi:hypothetical protein
VRSARRSTTPSTRSSSSSMARARPSSRASKQLSGPIASCWFRPGRGTTSSTLDHRPAHLHGLRPAAARPGNDPSNEGRRGRGRARPRRRAGVSHVRGARFEPTGRPPSEPTGPWLGDSRVANGVSHDR